MCLPSLSLSSLPLHFYILHLQSYRNHFEKFQRSAESRFGGSEKDRLSFKIPKWQHKLARFYKRGKLVSYFLNNATKRCLYELKISEIIETGHVFQSRVFFHLSNNLNTSCLSVFYDRNLDGIFRLILLKYGKEYEQICAKIYVR